MKISEGQVLDLLRLRNEWTRLTTERAAIPKDRGQAEPAVRRDFRAQRRKLIRARRVVEKQIIQWALNL